MDISIRADNRLQISRGGEMIMTETPTGAVLDAIEVVRAWAEKWQDPEKAALELAVAIAMEQTDDQTAEALSAAVKVWTEGERVEFGWLRSYGGKIFKAIKSHTTQADWTPPSTPSIWTAHNKTTDGAQVAEWTQPQGAHDAYEIGDRVAHDGAVWRSAVEANVWEPGVFGWIKED